MRKHLLRALLVCALLGFGSTAFAQSGDECFGSALIGGGEAYSMILELNPPATDEASEWAIHSVNEWMQSYQCTWLMKEYFWWFKVSYSVDHPTSSWQAYWNAVADWLEYWRQHWD